jgi:hypothetical protein
MEGLMAQPLLEDDPLRNVVVVRDDAGHLGLIEQVREGHVQPAPGAVGVPAAKLHAAGHAGTLERGVERLLGPRDVVRMDDLGAVGPQQRLGRVTHDAGDGGANVLDRGVGADDDHDVGRVLHERAKALLAAAQSLGESGILQGPARLRRKQLQRLHVERRHLMQAASASEHSRQPALRPDRRRDDRGVARSAQGERVGIPR